MIFLHLAISLSDKVLAIATVGGKVGRLTIPRYRFGGEMDAMCAGSNDLVSTLSIARGATPEFT